MLSSFQIFYKEFKESWRNSSIAGIKEVLSLDYQAREIRDQDIVDFEYAESIEGWSQAFNQLQEQNAQWILKEVGVIPLRENEVLAILWASLIIDDRQLETANLFFITFRWKDGKWKLIRSYIEAGLPSEKMECFELNRI
ncbi:flavoprotein [Fictibacillus sp. b24]|uniref:flavoprotein n=1 Tax=Fictibacillus sp. b24 TaxID=3055863 RepID=UPI0025A29FC9|nr:flavoprotein [Fictibacillus sp. b24]MDM5317096.1 flavoprotein [Fictibacillus sp. b24]